MPGLTFVRYVESHWRDYRLIGEPYVILALLNALYDITRARDKLITILQIGRSLCLVYPVVSLDTDDLFTRYISIHDRAPTLYTSADLSHYIAGEGGELVRRSLHDVPDAILAS